MELGSGPVTLAPGDKTKVTEFTADLLQAATEAPTEFTTVTVNPETRELLILVLICGLGAIESGTAEYDPNVG